MRYIFLIISVICLSFAPKSAQKVKVYMIGDSTMALKAADRRPETGWGMVLHQFFNDKVEIEDLAINGRSSKSFIGENRWQPVVDQLKKGDFVIIQFGHNDQKPDTLKHTTQEQYAKNLERYIADTKAKGATPIICTPIVRHLYDSLNVLIQTHEEYPATARKVAAAQNVTLIDLQKRTEELVLSLGKENSKQLYLYLQPGESPNYPKGNVDDTHLNVYGATKVAEFFVEEIRKSDCTLKKYIKK